MGIFYRHRLGTYKHAQGESGRDFVARVADQGMPSIGYAEILRWPVLELCRQVTLLHQEVEELRTEVSRLQESQ